MAEPIGKTWEVPLLSSLIVAGMFHVQPWECALPVVVHVIGVAPAAALCVLPWVCVQAACPRAAPSLAGLVGITRQPIL